MIGSTEISDTSHACATTVDDGDGLGDDEADALGDGPTELVGVGEPVVVGVGVGDVDATVFDTDGLEVTGLDEAAATPDHGCAMSSQTAAMTTTRTSSTMSRRRRYTAFDGRGRGSGLVTVTG